MFSVVIPLYNKELSIQNTIQSVLDQTFENFEIIIINDGSTDKSVEALKQFNDDRIRLFHQQNQGVSAARNKGIEEAKNEWIAFLDGDDEWYESKLQLFSKYLKLNPQTNWGFAEFDIFKDKELKKQIRYLTKDIILSNIFEDLLKGILIQTSSVVVRKSFLERKKINFSIGINNSEDREVWYKLCCCDKKPLFIPKPLSKYVIHSQQSSLTKSNIYNKKFNFINIMNRLKSHLIYIDDVDKEKLCNYINLINRIEIYNYWTKLRYMPIEFESAISSNEYKLLLKTVKLPNIIKGKLFNFLYRLKIVLGAKSKYI